MRKIQTLGIILAVVMLCGSIPMGFSEPLKEQLEKGIEIENIQCDNSNVLVQRPNGKLACVSERSAERLEWEIIQTSNDVSSEPIEHIGITELEERIDMIENSEVFWFDKREPLYHLRIQLEVAKYIEKYNWPSYSEEQVITQAVEYVESIDYLFSESEEYGKVCGLVLNENFTISKMIIDDKPYHNISMGSCNEHERSGLVGHRVAEVIINAENSTDIDYMVYDFGDG